MADDQPNQSQVIRCPACLASQSIASASNADAYVRCIRCGRRFQVRNALSEPRSVNQDFEGVPHAAIAHKNRLDVLAFVCVAMVLFGSLATAVYGRSMRGPGFLLAFTVLLVYQLIITTLVRHKWRDTWVISLIGFVCFQLVGVDRFLDGSPRGMHNFGFMVLTMVFGGLMFFVRAKSDESGYGIGGHCAGGSSYGGGCAGGGGCGGRGGCGGGGGCGGCGG